MQHGSYWRYGDATPKENMMKQQRRAQSVSENNISALIYTDNQSPPMYGCGNAPWDSDLYGEVAQWRVCTELW
jgi:hypothetical protein